MTFRFTFNKRFRRAMYKAAAKMFQTPSKQLTLENTPVLIHVCTCYVYGFISVARWGVASCKFVVLVLCCLGQTKAIRKPKANQVKSNQSKPNQTETEPITKQNIQVAKNMYVVWERVKYRKRERERAELPYTSKIYWKQSKYAIEWY